MISELYIQKLIRLIESNIITIADVKSEDYKTEIELRLNKT